MFFRVVWLALLIACGTATFSTVEDEEDAVSKEDVEVVPSADVVATSLVEYTTKQRLAWHFPCESDDAWTWGERDFTGQGVYSKNMRYVESLSLTVSGVLCDIRYLPRDVVFVIDTSSSMSSNDPTAADGSCVRSRAMDRMAAYLSRFDNARVGLVTYNSYVRAMSDHLVPAADFYADYLAQRERMQNLLCFSNYYTNYRRALLKTENFYKQGALTVFVKFIFSPMANHLSQFLFLKILLACTLPRDYGSMPLLLLWVWGRRVFLKIKLLVASMMCHCIVRQRTSMSCSSCCVNWCKPKTLGRN